MKRCILIPLLALAAMGCSGGAKPTNRPKTVNASGVVSQKGKPLASVIVMCKPETGDIACSGMSDENGNFSLSAFNPDPGAVPGKYTVAVQSTQQPQEHAEDVMVDRKIKPKPQAPPLPVKYASFETSGLKIEVPSEGTSSLKVDLPD
jgi:hypothetical protein